MTRLKLLDRRPNQRPLRTGDVVVLNSGGPRMLVLAIDAQGATCRWRTERVDRVHHFSEAMLTLIDDAPPAVLPC